MPGIMLDDERYVAEIATAGAELGRLCRKHPDETVRSCPEWTGGLLLAHLAGFVPWLSDLLDGRADVASEVPPVAPEVALRDWDVLLEEFVGRLRTTDPAAPVPNWSVLPDVARFWIRRSAHEFAMHAWDAATTTEGEPDPIPADIAADGLAEYLEAFVPTGLAVGAAPPAEATLVFELTDLGQVQTCHLPRPGPVTRLRGTASELLLAVWHRHDPLEFLVEGDRARIAAWPHI